MMNVCITAVRNLLDNSFGGGNRVLGLLSGLSKLPEVGKILFLSPLGNKAPYEKVTVSNYFSHRSFASLRRFHHINIVDETNPFRIASIMKIVKDFDITVLQNEGILGGLNSAVAAKKLNVPLVLDEHNFEYQYVREMGRSKPIQFYSSWLEARTKGLADHILSVSEEDKERNHNFLGIEPDKITVIPNGVDTKKFHFTSNEEKLCAKSELGVVDKFVLVFHGSLDYGPNRDAVVAIENYLVHEVPRYIPNAIFLIIGRNPPLVKHNSQMVRFTGYVSDLVPYLTASDVAIMPLMRGGGTRTKALEYLAMGIPIVATTKAVEGLRIKNRVHGLISDSVDRRFVQDIVALYNDEPLRKRLSLNARQLAEEYDWKNIALDLYDVYKNLDCV